MAAREMEFISFDVKTKTLTLKKQPIPKPKADEVLIKVAYSGVCGTDLHIIEGAFPCKSDGPLTLGHEFVGTAEAVGPFVTSIKVGQRIAVDPNSGCQNCHFCHNAKYHLCAYGGIHTTIGIFRHGGWATHCIVPETQVYGLPDNIDLQEAALTEPLSCLAHGLDLLNPINIGTRILITGAGIIGLLWASVLHLLGHRKIVAISEMQDKRRQLAEKLGYGYEVTEPTKIGNDKYDLAIDCSGAGPAIESGLHALDRGGRLCIFGVANPKTIVPINPFKIYKDELTIVGVNINPFSFRKGINLVRSLGKTYLDYEKLGIKIYKLSEYHEALELLRKGVISKVVFKV